ncbi:hypothetical protein JXA31_08150 [Candidatus Bathyarchaeota archaeon]|nr:hypothetical protein [Candidatus Bathyarchaeota archaeon]
MSAKTLEFKICGHCGSIAYLEDYPVTGTTICAKCAQQIIKIPLRELPEEEIIQQPCPFCGKEGEEDDTVFDDDNIMVFKCKGCGKLDGYRIALEPTYADNEDLEDVEYSGKAVAIAKREGSYLYSASKAKELSKALQKKEKDPIEQNTKQLHQLIKTETEPLKKLGITDSTITNAFSQARNHIVDKDAITEKQLVSLVAASILLAEDIQVRRRELPKGFATERNISEIFNVDRKTIRKWKRQMEEKRHHPKWGVYIYRPNGLLESGIIEIPEDIEAVTKLEKPYNGKCCILGGDYPISWRIKYKNGSWSDICQRAYESFQKTYWENEGPLNLP